MTEQHDRDELVELMSRYANMPDTQNWDELPRSVFCDEITCDFSALGAPVTTINRDAWCQRRSRRSPLDGHPPRDLQPSDRHRRGSCDPSRLTSAPSTGLPLGRCRRTELLAGRRLLRRRRRANSRGLAAELGQADPVPPGERGAARGHDGGGEGLTSPPHEGSRSWGGLGRKGVPRPAARTAGASTGGLPRTEPADPRPAPRDGARY